MYLFALFTATHYQALQKPSNKHRIIEGKYYWSERVLSMLSKHFGDSLFAFPPYIFHALD